MEFENVLAGVAVKELDPAVAWYERLLGAVGHKPMALVAEWKFPRGGGLQVFADPARAGHSSITLTFEEFDRQLDRLREEGVHVEQVQRGERIDLAFLRDPAGNRVVLARSKDKAHVT